MTLPDERVMDTTDVFNTPGTTTLHGHPRLALQELFPLQPGTGQRGSLGGSRALFMECGRPGVTCAGALAHPSNGRNALFTHAQYVTRRLVSRKLDVRHLWHQLANAQ